MLLRTDDDSAGWWHNPFFQMNKHLTITAFNGRIPERVFVGGLVAVNQKNWPDGQGDRRVIDIFIGGIKKYSAVGG